MVLSCVVYGCQAKWTRGGKYTFHVLPHDAERRKLWVRNIGPTEFGIGKNSRVCSKHFTADSFDQSKLGGTWLTSTAVPTIFNFAERSKATGENGETSTSYTGTTGSERKGDFEYEETGLPQKSAEKTLAQIDPCETISFEPEIVIKEEPIDIDETQLPSTSRTGDEFILPGWTPTPSTGHTPELGVAFTVVKTEDGSENGNNGQSESQQSEDDSNKDRTKDHFDAYGEYIAAKLRKLDWKSCAHVQKAIGDIIFEAEMGKYK